jgi:hypothetical protein
VASLSDQREEDDMPMDTTDLEPKVSICLFYRKI